MNLPESMRWQGGTLRLLDQRLLPRCAQWIECADAPSAHRAIATLQVRGAPAIGICAAYGLAMAWRDGADVAAAARSLRSARPTAVNLAWALDRLLAVHARGGDLIAAAEAIHAEDRAACAAIGAHGADLIAPGCNALTHCNAGALATSQLGTATAAFYEAKRRGIDCHVFVDETRPVLQGARLTCWELAAAGIDHTLICDSAAAHLMGEGAVDLVIVGADRVVANGDAANKIGTRGLAIAARYHGVPFYVACPSSTFDAGTATGADVIVEERGAQEVLERTPAPPGVRVRNPAFDVTPAALIAAYITEFGLLRGSDGLAAALRSSR